MQGSLAPCQASRCVNVLEGREEVGSMLLQVAMLLQYQCYRSLQEHCPRNSIVTSSLKQIFAEDWDRMDASTRATHRSKLHRQLERGRRWSIVTKRLSFGVLILGGKKLSTQVHDRNLNIEKLELMLSHIVDCLLSGSC
ncbi:hypothetical protein BDBG_01499 [Blastomyces gilchristii SLH14081]|uniref:Uncharacterized protein n=1 Tax=Blastomyces gilchristii (strain SLH14081) TaxID=559298 RepID=A0A179UD14_BLAGS|nr:uncharacterized protein BDBG_01499 [Blastomyces gilchristii SLH14081]OAT05047.1 hypothetical protein BDBG_01499 [Blastomyces gilchristii SLH14081]